MRREMTPAEQTLWFELRAGRLGGVKFRRQKVIGPYIADFAANKPKLVVEVDGHTHGDRVSYDVERTRPFQEQGYRVVRFTNQDVMANLEGVLQQLTSLIHRSPLPTLSPEGERAFRGPNPLPFRGEGETPQAARERGTPHP